MPTYKDQVRTHVQELLDDGSTQAEVAKKLGLEHPNFLSMVLNPKHAKTLLPPSKLPALQQLCSLTDMQALKLFRLACSPSSGKKSMCLDLPTVDWLIRVTVGAKRESDAKQLALSALTKAASHE